MDNDARRAALAYVAGGEVEIPEEELNEATRRALVVRAVGGNPPRELRLDEEQSSASPRSSTERSGGVS